MMQQPTLGSTSSSPMARETSFMRPSQRAFNAFGRFSVINATFSPSPFFSTLMNSNEVEDGEDAQKRRVVRGVGSRAVVSVAVFMLNRSELENFEVLRKALAITDAIVMSLTGSKR